MKGDWKKLLERWKEGRSRYGYALLVAALGVVLLLLPGGGDPKPVPASEREQAESFELDRFEARLEQVLSQVEGAGSTRVMLTLDSGSRRVLAEDRDLDREGTGGSTVVTVGQGSGRQEVVPLQTLAPQFRGALVVCPGGRDPEVRLRLIQALTALTGLGADQIAVCAGNGPIKTG